jgi:hypothetical protein
MPAHDWTRVEAGIFHAFHSTWVAAIQAALNEGLLPVGYYALAEQHVVCSIMDILTPYATPTPPPAGATAVGHEPPRVRRRQTIELRGQRYRHSLAIREVGGHRLVALVEILPPAVRHRAWPFTLIPTKAADALDSGVHLLLLDLFPPRTHDLHGMQGADLECPEEVDEPYVVPVDEPLLLAAYAAGPAVEVFLNHVAFGADLPEMPLFLRPDRYVSVPLEPTYQTAYRGMPVFWRDVLEGRPPQIP